MSKACALAVLVQMAAEMRHDCSPWPHVGSGTRNVLISDEELEAVDALAREEYDG